jgi:hypothetical protein
VPTLRPALSIGATRNSPRQLRRDLWPAEEASATFRRDEIYESGAAGPYASIADGRRSDSIADRRTIAQLGSVDFGSHLFEP